MQTVIAEINHKIGASGVISQECKAVVAEYGQQILDMLIAQVCSIGFKSSMCSLLTNLMN